MSSKTRNGRNKRAGRRYTIEEKTEILEQAGAPKRSVAEVAEQYGCSEWTIYRWQKKHPDLVPTASKVIEPAPETREPAEATSSTSDPDMEAEEEVASTRPHRIDTPAQDRVKRLVLETKKDHAPYGPAQIQAYLRRFEGLMVSIKVIGKILKAAGYELQKRKAKEPEAPERFEMRRPNEMWQIDVLQFRIIEQRVYLLHIIDDYSRFSVGHVLLTSVKAEDVIELVCAATTRYGKPEALLSDRGPQFSVFRGMTQFEKWLEEALVDHVKARAYHPQTIGKLEALNRTLHEEVLDQREFLTITEAREHLSKWFRRYNFERPHLGIAGLLPADRYFGREQEVRELIARAITAGGRDLRAAGAFSTDRNSRLDCMVLQLRLVHDQLELWFAGKKVRLG